MSISSNGLIYIEAEVIDYSNTNLESVSLNWKYSAEDGPFVEVLLENESDNVYIGTFPQLNPNSEIEYFISTSNILGDAAFHPNAGWHIFNTLDSLQGDINQDGSINIQDIILTINLVLNNEYDNSADLNSDNSIDILDIVQLVNLILN